MYANLFVYGNLMRGESEHDGFSDALEYLGVTRTCGSDWALYNPGYDAKAMLRRLLPFDLQRTIPCTRIVGEVYVIRDMAEFTRLLRQRFGWGFTVDTVRLENDMTAIMFVALDAPPWIDDELSVTTAFIGSGDWKDRVRD